jgi:hypothetical protein
MKSNEDPLEVAEHLLTLPIKEAINRLKSSTPNTASYFFAGGIHGVEYPWIELKPHLLKKHSDEVIRTFLDELTKESNRVQRRNIVLGLRLKNSLLKIDFMEQLGEINPEMEPERCQVFVKRLKELTEGTGLNSKEIEKTIADLTQERIDPKGDNQEQAIWSSFCEYIIWEEKLPTKWVLRDQISLEITREEFSRRTTRLGLKGLPEAKRTS